MSFIEGWFLPGQVWNTSVSGSDVVLRVSKTQTVEMVTVYCVAAGMELR